MYADLPTALVSYYYYNTLPQTQWHKTTQIYVAVLEVKSWQRVCLIDPK